MTVSVQQLCDHVENTQAGYHFTADWPIEISQFAWSSEETNKQTGEVIHRPNDKQRDAQNCTSPTKLGLAALRSEEYGEMGGKGSDFDVL